MFFLSLLMIFIFSYLVLSLIAQKTDRVYGFLYLLLIAFSQIIFSFEVLSLFSLINRNNFLISNFIFLIVSCLLFVKSERKFYIPEIKSEINRIKNSLKHDKLLMFCALCFLFYLIFQIIIVCLSPVSFGDALSYYFSRALEWLQNGNLNHFTTGDNRELVMPINSELLYLMHFLFLKTEKFIGIYSFTGYLAGVYLIYVCVKELFISTRKALWSVFIFSSLTLVFLTATMPCAELLAGVLLLSCIFLFLMHVKYKDKVALYFSALAAAIAAGVKTTALIAFPSVGLALILICLLYKQNKKSILKFILLFLLNFFLFSAFNYILNFISFSNPITSRDLFVSNRFIGGFKGYFYNLLHYCLFFFDPSGFPSETLCNAVNKLQLKTFELFGLNEADYFTLNFSERFRFVSGIKIWATVFGVLGFFAVLPSLFYSFFAAFNTRKKKTIPAAIFAMTFIVNILLFSRVMLFTSFNNKYIITLALAAIPTVAYSYFKKTNLYKGFLVFLIFLYLFINAGNYAYFYVSRKPVNVGEEAEIYNGFKSLPKGKILLIINQGHSQTYYFLKSVFDGFKVNKYPIEYVKHEKLSRYDYIITENAVEMNVLPVEMPNTKQLGEDCEYIFENVTVSGKTLRLPSSALCRVPHEYFAQNGFQYLFETDKYIVLKNGAK